MTAPGRATAREDDAPHAVAFYDSEESLRARVVPYLRQGLDRGETVVAVVSDAAEQIVRSALGGDADRVHWRAGEVSYHRLGAMFEGFRQFLADQRAAGARMRLLTQNDVAGGPGRLGAYLRNEAMTTRSTAPSATRGPACMTGAPTPRRRCGRSARFIRGYSNPAADRSAAPST